MTRERFEQVQREWETALACNSSFTIHAVLLMWGETIKALREAWAKIDEVERQNLDLTVQRDTAITQRDYAIHAGVEPTIAKESMEKDLKQSTQELEAWVQWAYTLGLQLDWFTPAIGVDNRERIEKAVKALKTVTAQRDAALMEGNALTIEKDGMQILIDELRKGHDRYETARRLNPVQWSDAWKLNISTGKPFDEIIDDLRPFVRPEK